MSNAIATLPIWDDKEGKLTSTAVNAKEDKQSFNITLDHQFDEHLTLSASYSHMKDEWKAKSGWVLRSELGLHNRPDDINTAINSLRPANHYSLNLSYENGKLYTGLLTNWYTGLAVIMHLLIMISLFWTGTSTIRLLTILLLML